MVEHVERGAALDGVQDPLGVDVESRRERGDERLNILRSKIGDQVGILGAAGDAMHGAGDRASYKIWDLKLLHDSSYLEGDPDRVRQLHLSNPRSQGPS